MIEIRKTALLLSCVLLMAFFAGCAEAGRKEETIEAGDPYMTEAINEALKGIRSGHGGLFGCVIIKDGEIIGRGHNRVLIDNDSTAHGEIVAIRNAERKLGSYVYAVTEGDWATVQRMGK